MRFRLTEERLLQIRLLAVMTIVVLFLGLLGANLAERDRHRLTLARLEALEVARQEVEASAAELAEELARAEAYMLEVQAQLDRLDALEEALRQRVPGLVGPQSDARPTARIASVKPEGALLAQGAALEGGLAELADVTNAWPTLWPVLGGRLTSGYGYRQDPWGGPDEQFHAGLDIAARRGSPVVAAGPGRVIHAGWLGVYGLTVIVDHGHGIQSLYGHLDRIRVGYGVWVARGQAIGSVGSTGRSTGYHLHFEIRVGCERVDPWDWLQGVP